MEPPAWIIRSAKFDKLVGDVDATKVPEGFDYVIWEAFVPEDNEMTPERVALGKITMLRLWEAP
jgi:hypothetical protein